MWRYLLLCRRNDQHFPTWAKLQPLCSLTQQLESTGYINCPFCRLVKHEEAALSCHRFYLRLYPEWKHLISIKQRQSKWLLQKNACENEKKRWDIGPISKMRRELEPIWARWTDAQRRNQEKIEIRKEKLKENGELQRTIDNCWQHPTASTRKNVPHPIREIVKKMFILMNLENLPSAKKVRQENVLPCSGICNRMIG